MWAFSLETVTLRQRIKYLYKIKSLNDQSIQKKSYDTLGYKAKVYPVIMIIS